MKFIKRFNESKSIDQITDMFDDIFIYLLDDYGLNFHLTEGEFINGIWIVRRMSSEAIKVLKKGNSPYVRQMAYQVTIGFENTINGRGLEDFKHFSNEKISNLNDDLRKLSNRFEKLHPEFKIKYLPNVTKDAWTITFYIIGHTISKWSPNQASI